MPSKIFEVINKPGLSTRVTITKDRTSIKISKNVDEATRRKIIDFVRSIEDEVRQTHGKSMRGMFNEEMTVLVLWNNSRTGPVRYKF